MTISRILFAILLCAVPVSAFAQVSSYPDGYVIWNSNRQDSRVEVYRARADGTEVTRLTYGGGNLPSWSPDGRWISFMDPSDTVYLMRPDGSELHPVIYSGRHIMWMHDNSGLFYQLGGEFRVYDPETGESTFIFSQGDYQQFAGTTFQVNAITHDSRYVLMASHLYINGYTGSNGSFTSEYSAIVLDLLHKDKVYFLGSGCWPFTPPLGDLVFHICADCPNHPDIYRMHLADLDTRASYAAEVAHEDSDWGHEYNPRVSNDNRWVAYMASAGCHQGEGCDYDIWLHQLGADPSQRLRVTQDASFDGYPQLYVGPLWQPSAAPRLLVTPNRVTFHASAGALPPAKLLQLKNTGGGTLGVATATVDQPMPWLDITPGPTGISVGLRPGATITRGTQCTNLTVTVADAVGSPVTIPITLIADESFPMGGPLDGGISLDAGWSVETGVVDSGIPDAPVSSPDLAVTIVADGAASLDCDALAGTPDAPGGLDAGTGGAKDTGGGGCSCSLGRRAASAGPLGMLLVGLAAMLRRRRRR